jgi:hypothetical protein
VDPVSEAGSVQQPPDRQLRGGVPPTVCLHVPTDGRRRCPRICRPGCRPITGNHRISIAPEGPAVNSDISDPAPGPVIMPTTSQRGTKGATPTADWCAVSAW